jgi:hypothetical protein
MRGNLLAVALVVTAVSASTTAAAPPISHPPQADNAVENLVGHLDISTRGQQVIVTLSAEADGAVDRQFTVGLTQSAALLLRPFRADAARVLSWPGHLVVMVDREHMLFHFSVAGFDPPDQLSGDALFGVPAGPRLEAQAAKYSITRIVGAQALYSSTPEDARSLSVLPAATPGASFLQDCCLTGDSTCCIDYQDYSSDGGGGGCPTACNLSCGLSSCSASCGYGHCAHCSCPGPSCSCS